MTNPSFIEAKKAEVRKKWNVLFAGKLIPNDPFITEEVVERFLDETLESFFSEIEGRVVPEEDKPKLGSENQDTYVAFAHGFNDCRAEVKANFQHLRTGETN
jgi:hypothetical protein